MKQFLGYIILISAIAGLFSCSKSSSTTATSDVARLTSFYLTGPESETGLTSAVFDIEEGVDTGLVTTGKDSIQFGTSLKRIVPRFTCEATPGSVTLQLGDTTVTLGTSDTLDLTKTPLVLTIISSDLTKTKRYKVVPTVHSVDPDLYLWETLSTAMYPVEDEEQQAVLLGDQFLLFCNNGFSNRLFTSDDAATWTQGTLSGLPDVCRVKGILSNGKKLYYTEPETLYTSEDGVTWKANDYKGKDFTMETMLMTFNDTVWLVLRDTLTKSLVLGQINADTIRRTGFELDENFPISGFATVEFESLSERRRAAIIGGYSQNGECINSRWNIEYAPTIKGLYHIMNYSIEQPEFSTLTGVSVIWYKKQLMLFGGVNKDMVFRKDPIMISEDEGYTWQVADTAKCKLPETYTPRQKQSVLVKDNNIYVIGGQNQQQTFVDSYKGRLNSIDWED